MAAHSGEALRHLAGALLERGADPNAAERGYTPLTPPRSCAATGNW